MKTSRTSIEALAGNGQPSLLDDGRHAAYAAYYRNLARLREHFHSTGRFDDANAKLDEMTKLFAMRVHEARVAREGGIDRFRTEYLEEYARDHFGDSTKIALALRALSEEVLNDLAFRSADGASIFGSRPTLNLQPTDDRFAAQMVVAVRDLVPDSSKATASSLEHFDLLAESFGHFVRDTFRQTKEDAQYMTPLEVVAAMTEIAFLDLGRHKDEVQRLLEPDDKNPYLILDPTCGVGSFLIQALRQTILLAEREGLDAQERARLADRLRACCLLGQDKVDRMVRLAGVNLSLFGGGEASIWQGNSVLGASRLDGLQGKVDLILTNPPFGAEYETRELLGDASNPRYPLLNQLHKEKALPKQLNSELILLDRYLSLLRPGGRLLAVLPNSVIAGNGVEKRLREQLEKYTDLKAVVELPAVAFAQAGTRTKTCFVYLQKHDKRQHTGNGKTLMAVCDDVGFDVVQRTGALVKVAKGTNQLPAISRAYGQELSDGIDDGLEHQVVSEEPSAVRVLRRAIPAQRWSPNAYHVRRLGVVADLQGLTREGYVLHPLRGVARLCSRERRRGPTQPGTKIISVLHVSTDGAIDLGKVANYVPKTAGITCEAGEVLFSKINPRIPRICVVPNAGFPLACSTEFEILKPLDGLDPYLLSALLGSSVVQQQVQYLTSGTSSSHNRIKDTELGDVLIPLPTKDAAPWREFSSVAEELRSALTQRYESDRLMLEASRKVESLIAIRGE